VIALPNLLAHVARHGDAIFDAHARDRAEWNDVGGSETRMGTFVRIQVDQFRSFANAANRGFLNGFTLANQRDHAPVVIRVHLAVEQKDTVNFHGGNYRVNFRFVASFGKIGDAFDQSLHTRKAYPVSRAFAKLQKLFNRIHETLCGVPLWNSVSSVVQDFKFDARNEKALTTEDTGFHRGKAQRKRAHTQFVAQTIG
jgi:hypothetical protein